MDFFAFILHMYTCSTRGTCHVCTVWCPKKNEIANNAYYASYIYYDGTMYCVQLYYKMTTQTTTTTTIDVAPTKISLVFLGLPQFHRPRTLPPRQRRLRFTQIVIYRTCLYNH